MRPGEFPRSHLAYGYILQLCTLNAYIFMEAILMLNNVHLCQPDYDQLLEQGKIHAARAMCFSGANEKETYAILLDGVNLGARGKFIDGMFHLLNGDGSPVIASVEAFRKHLERLLLDKIANSVKQSPDYELAKRLLKVLNEEISGA